MAARPLDVDLHAMTPEEFARLVKEHDDATLLATFRSVGVGAALDRIFDIMQERYRTENARDVDATVVWRITDGHDTYPYSIRLDGPMCRTEAGETAGADTTLTLDLARFARVAAGQANGVKLLLTRKLKASGDINLARRMPTLFDIPSV